MDKIDQYLYLIDDIASIYGKILNFSFFCQNFHNVSMCKNENCDVGNFVKRLIKNIRFNHLIDQKKKKYYFVYHFLNAEDICLIT